MVNKKDWYEAIASVKHPREYAGSTYETVILDEASFEAVIMDEASAMPRELRDAANAAVKKTLAERINAAFKGEPIKSEPKITYARPKEWGSW